MFPGALHHWHFGLAHRPNFDPDCGRSLGETLDGIGLELFDLRERAPTLSDGLFGAPG
jgi:hypothetical protein